MVGCRVTLLDGTTFEPKGIDKNATGQVLFDKVVKHLDIIETDYFGLTYRDKSGKKFWLDHSKKISKQVNGGMWVFEFQVKFYTPDPMSLKEDITRYQLCLQLRVDIFNGKLPCSFATYALLGSYTVQGELGDWDPVEFGEGLDYLNDFDFAPTQNPELLEKIAELHKHHKGLTPTMAEAHFLENAKKLAMFGVDLHDAKDSENKDIQLGVCANGILVYQDRLRINRFVWPKILKLSYKRNNFYVRVRPGEFEPHERTIMFKLENHKLAKRLWKTCVEHHAFFRLKETDPHQTDTLFPRFNTKFRYSGRTAHQARKAAEQVQRDEPHIARTAERRSLGHIDKPRHLDDGTLEKRPPDESDKYDKKRDPNATAEMGANANAALQDGKYKTAPSDVKASYMQLLSETPTINSQTRWTEAQQDIQHDPRYHAVPSDAQREEWFDEYIQNLLKTDYMQLLHDTPSITSQTPYEEAQQAIYDDPRYQAVPTDAQREQWYDEYINNLKKNEFMNLLHDTPAITSNTKWSEAKKEIQSDPRYQAVPSDAQREEWFNEYIQSLGPPPYSPGGKKDKKAKEEEKRRKKEEEKRRKEKEKERKRLEKEKKKHKGKPAETNIDGDQADQHQELDKEKEKRHSGGLFGMFGRKSLKDNKEKQEEVTPAVKTEAEVEEEFVEQLKEDFTQLLRETPDITSQSRLKDVKHKIEHDPRYKAVGSDDKREKWFNDYVDKLLKADFMRLLMETPTIHSQSTWKEARQEIDLDPRFQAVNSEAQREEWFNEYVQNLLKQDYMQLLKDTPSIHSQSRWESVKEDIEADSRYMAVGNDAKREAWFDEYIQNLKKEEFMQLLRDTPDITAYSHYKDVREDISNDPRFNNVDTEAQREEYFNEYVQNLKKEGFMQLLRDTPDITAYTPWHEAKQKIDTDPRYHAADSDLQRARWYNEHVNRLAGIYYSEGDFGLSIGDYKSIDRKQEYLPIAAPNVTTRKPQQETMPFFEPVGDDEADVKKRVPPPVAKKPRGSSGYEAEEDRLLRNSTGVPVTVETETFKYSPDTDDMPKATSNIPIVETKTQKVTYEKDGVPYETEDSILISAHSVTTKSQTIDTTTYKTERDGMVETRVERKITVMSDGDDIDHDALLRAAIEQVTNMNQSFEVEKIEYMRQIDDK